MGTRFQRGAAQPTVIAAPQHEILPGVDRPTAVLVLGGGLALANGWPVVKAVVGVSFGQSGSEAYSAGGAFKRLGLELGLVAFLYLLAHVSDEAGSFSILLLVALWVVWLVLHANQLNPSGAGSVQNLPASTGAKKG